MSLLPEDLFSAEHNRKKINKAVRLFKNKELRVGDNVYCSKALEDVILLDTPPFDRLYYYETQGVFPFEIVYETPQREIEQAPIGCITKISKGKYEGNIEIKHQQKNKIDFFFYLARAEGFRVEKVFKDYRYLINIYGDSEIKVNQFIENANYTYEKYFG